MYVCMEVHIKVVNLLQIFLLIFDFAHIHPNHFALYLNTN